MLNEYNQIYLNNQINEKNSEKDIYLLFQQLLYSLNQNSILSVDNVKFIFSKYLNTHFKILERDENKIINEIFEKLNYIYLGDIQKITRFQDLYLLLKKKKILSKRWCIIYLLLSLSKSNYNNYNFVKSNKLLKTLLKINTGIDDDDINYEMKILNKDPYFENQNLNIKNTMNYPIVVNLNKTINIITEKDLINDLMFVFQGINGKYITYDNNKDCFILNQYISFKENIYDIIGELSELGWLCKKLKFYLNFFKEKHIASLYIQSLSYSIQNELNEYYKLIAFFKKKNNSIYIDNTSPIHLMNYPNKISNDNPQNIIYIKSNKANNEFTLKNLILWTKEPIERMKWLVMICDSVFNLNGSSIISQIYSYNYFSKAEIYLKRVLEDVMSPFYDFIKNWIKLGELRDYYKEFFVDIVDDINDDDIWKLKYKMIYQNIPNFLSEELAIKIFETGKCIHFIRNYCNESNYNIINLKNILIQEISNENEGTKFIDVKSYKSCLEFINQLYNEPLDDISIKSKEISQPLMINNYDNIPYLNNNSFIKKDYNLNNLKKNSKENLKDNFLLSLTCNIDLIHNLINKELINIFYIKFKFKENLNSINKYLLLGQGDMMQNLLENLYEELKKPASVIYKHNLQSCLEASIRSTNAQYNDKECLKKLNIKLLDSKIGDVGWDIFLLEYSVESPLTVIFNKNTLKQYQKLFFFFWKIKRLEYSQDHQIWRKFMSLSHSLKENFDYMRNKIQKSILFNQQILHFINNLHNFLALEVLEVEYKKLIELLPKVTNLNELEEYHEKFVENIIKKCLLNVENSVIFRKIINIFNLIINFRTALDVLTTTSLEEQFNNYYTTEDNNEENNNTSMNFNKRFSNEAFNQISDLFEQFKNEVYNLIVSINSSSQDHLKYLAMKLDYNYYYSLREFEKENKKQEEIINKLNYEHEKRRIKQFQYLNTENEEIENEEEEREGYNHISYGNNLNNKRNLTSEKNALNNNIPSFQKEVIVTNNNNNMNFTNDIEMMNDDNKESNSEDEI